MKRWHFALVSMLLAMALVSCAGEQEPPIPVPPKDPPSSSSSAPQSTVDGTEAPTGADYDTIRWLNLTYAPYTLEDGREDFNSFGGGRRTEEYVDKITADLSEEWDITDRKSAEYVINWFQTTGVREDFIRAVRQLEIQGLMELSDLDFINKLRDEYAMESVRASAWLNVANIYRQYGEDAVNAWNDSCTIRVLAHSYIAGYYTFDEAMAQAVEIGKKLQEQYPSWDAMMKSYTVGYSFYLGRGIDWDAAVAGTGRYSYYDRLLKRKDNPYQLPWGTPLVWEPQE